jgi:hypothetical protein
MKLVNIYQIVNKKEEVIYIGQTTKPIKDLTINQSSKSSKYLNDILKDNLDVYTAQFITSVDYKFRYIIQQSYINKQRKLDKSFKQPDTSIKYYASGLLRNNTKSNGNTIPHGGLVNNFLEHFTCKQELSKLLNLDYFRFDRFKTNQECAVYKGYTWETFDSMSENMKQLILKSNNV